jgi:hypothetical protein
MITASEGFSCSFKTTDALGCESPAVYYAVDFPLTYINDIDANKQLLKITDVLGRKVNRQKNVVLLYHFDDGTVEKKLIAE